MYPSEQEKAAIEAAEKFMIETMVRYDPSHDAYHGERVTILPGMQPVHSLRVAFSPTGS